MRTIQGLLETLRTRGVGAFVRQARAGALRRFRHRLDSEFDRKYGVDTVGTIELSELGVKSPTVPDSLWYEPIPEKIFRALMSQVDVPYGDYTFVDVGSGKGRALLMASEYPFARVLGVEFAEPLHLVTLENFRRFPAARRRCQVLDSVCVDAAQFEWPPAEQPFVFLYNPFKPPLLRAVLENLVRSLDAHPRAAAILFYGSNPDSIAILEELPGFEVRRLDVPHDLTREVTRKGVFLQSKP